MTNWHEERLLIDGELVPAAGGATYETINPATEAVLGVAADATRRRRRARDRRGPARVRHDGVVARPRAARALPASAPRGAAGQRRPAARDPRARRSARRSRARAARSSRARSTSCAGTPICSRTTTSSRTSASATPSRAGTTAGSRRRPRASSARSRRTTTRSSSRSRSSRPRSRPGCTVVLKGAPDTPVGDARARQARRRGDRHPAGRRERAHRRPTTRSAPS